jgi:hypothetical protein
MLVHAIISLIPRAIESNFDSRNNGGRQTAWEHKGVKRAKSRKIDYRDCTDVQGGKGYRTDRYLLQTFRF